MSFDPHKRSIFTRSSLVAFASVLALALAVSAGSLTPSAAPASTMNTLEELYDSIAGVFDSSAITSSSSGSLIEHLKYIEENMASLGVGSDSLDFDEFVDSMTLDADTTIASAGFMLTTGSLGIGIAGDLASASFDTATDALRFGINGFQSLVIDQTLSNTAVGYGALRVTTGSANSAFGRSALYSNTTAFFNSAFGYEAMYFNTTGDSNNAFGTSAMRSNTTGFFNNAFGTSAMYNSTTGSRNNAFGYEAMLANTTGGSNNAFGEAALYLNTTGSTNTALGARALTSNTTASNNTALGAEALFSNETGTDLVAVGASAGYSNTTASGNTFVGRSAGRANTTGSLNVAVGYQSLLANTTGLANTAVGYSALSANTTGVANIALGNHVLSSNTTGGSNVGAGASALFSNTTGARNTAIGANALLSNTTGTAGAAFGYQALVFNTTGQRNAAVGAHALNNNTTGSDNIAVGASAGYSNTTASGNTFIGRNAGRLNTTGFGLVAVGYQSLQANTTGEGNNAFGVNALTANTTGGRNNAFGENALAANTTGAQNSAFGGDALSSNTTGNSNNAFGVDALYDNTTGERNSAFGLSALSGNQTGDRNSAFGYEALSGNLTGTANAALGSGALYLNNAGSNNVALGASAGYSVLGSGNIFLGRSAGYQETGSNTLWIDNASTASSSAFIYGDLTVNTLSFGADVSVSSDFEVEGHVALGNSAEINEHTAFLGPGIPFPIVVNIQETITDLDDAFFEYGQAIGLVLDPATVTADEYIIGSEVFIKTEETNSADYTGAITGIQGYVQHLGSGDAAIAIGMRGLAQADAGTIASASGGIFGVEGTGTGTIDYGYGLRIHRPITPSKFTNLYGLSIQNQFGAGNSFNIYSQGATSRNLFEGHASVGGNFELSGTVSSHLIPTAHDTYDLGSSTLRWRDLYLASGSLHIGVSGDEAVIDYNVNDDYLSFKPDGSTTRVVITDAGNVGIASSSPNEKLAVEGNVRVNGQVHAGNGIGYGFLAVNEPLQSSHTGTGDGAAVSGTYVMQTASSSLNVAYGGLFAALTDGANASNFAALGGLNASAIHLGTGTIARMFGAALTSSNISSGNITALSGVDAQVNNYGSGIVTSGAGMRVLTPSGAANITNLYGLFVENQTGATNNWNIYSAGAASRNLFEGHASISGNLELSGLPAADANDVYICRDPTTNLITTSAAACVASSLKFKENIEDLEHGLDWVHALRPVTFDWKHNGKPSLGFIAEEVNEVSPLLAVRQDGEVFSVNYQIVTSVLAKAIQELDGKIASLSTEGPMEFDDDSWFEGLFSRIVDSFASLLGVEFGGGGNIKAKQLCLDDICVTKDQLQELLEESGVEASTPTPEPEESATPTPESTPESSEDPEPTDEPAPEESPDEVPEEPEALPNPEEAPAE